MIGAGETPRPVWLTAAEIDKNAGELALLVARRFIGSPVDPLEVAQAAVCEVCYPQCTPDEVDKAGRDVVRALGMPDA